MYRRLKSNQRQDTSRGFAGLGRYQNVVNRESDAAVPGILESLFPGEDNNERTLLANLINATTLHCKQPCRLLMALRNNAKEVDAQLREIFIHIP